MNKLKTLLKRIDSLYEELDACMIMQDFDTCSIIRTRIEELNTQIKELGNE